MSSTPLLSHPDDTARFRPRLAPGERLLWAGRPQAWKLFVPGDWYLVPFSIFFGLFSVIPFAVEFGRLVSGAQDHGSPPFVSIFTLVIVGLFAVIGFYLMIGRLIVKVITKKRTRYAVTDRRVLVLSGLFAVKDNSLFLDPLSLLGKRVRRNGTGSILFGDVSAAVGMYLNTGLDFASAFFGPPPLAFYDIPHADDVFRLISRTRLDV